jgi:hypothetical protein
MPDMRVHAVMGVVPPDVGEAVIATRWPSVAARGALAQLGSQIQNLASTLFRWTLNLPTFLFAIIVVPITVICFLIALVGWLILAPFFFLRFVPGLAQRYTLTNRRIMIQRGLKPAPIQEVKLTEFEAVRVVPGTEQPFYHSANLEIISGGKPVMTLHGVAEYENFITNIEDAYKAWARPQPKDQAFAASTIK